MSANTQPDAEAPVRARRRFRLIILAPVLALIALITWSVASPIGASPDDDYHLASIWCASPAHAASCAEGAGFGERNVPEALFLSSTCYAFHSEVSAACQEDSFSTDPSETVLTTRGSFDGLYPPVYYATVGLFVTDDIESWVIVTRIVNAVLFVAITTALYLLLPHVRRPTLVWMWLLTTIPLGIFLLASNNPSAWAIIGTGSLWIALLAYFETTGRRRIGLAAIVVITAVMAGGARADSAVYAGLSIAVVILLTFERSKSYYLQAILPVALAVMSGAFYLTSGQAAVATTGLTTGATHLPEIGTLMIYNLLHVQELWVGSFGVWNLGWLDTPMPLIVTFGAVTAVVAIVFTSLTFLSRRKAIAVGIVAFVLLALPLYVLAAGRALVGQAVQPRYLLPLLVVFVGLVLLPAVGRSLRLTRLQLWIVVPGLVAAQSAALHENIRRYITGMDYSGYNLDETIEWWWSADLTPMTVWVIGTLAYGAAAVILVREITRPGMTPLPEPGPLPSSTVALTD